MNQPFKLGITGYIAMGKTTVSSIFSKKNIPVWDADKAVHKIYEKDGTGYKVLTIKFPKNAYWRGSHLIYFLYCIRFSSLKNRLTHFFCLSGGE